MDKQKECHKLTARRTKCIIKLVGPTRVSSEAATVIRDFSLDFTESIVERALLLMRNAGRSTLNVKHLEAVLIASEHANQDIWTIFSLIKELSQDKLTPLAKAGKESSALQKAGVSLMVPTSCVRRLCKSLISQYTFYGEVKLSGEAIFCIAALLERNIRKVASGCSAIMARRKTLQVVHVQIYLDIMLANPEPRELRKAAIKEDVVEK